MQARISPRKARTVDTPTACVAFVVHADLGDHEGAARLEEGEICHSLCHAGGTPQGGAEGKAGGVKP